MVWYGVVWCGVVWCGAVWCGVVVCRGVGYYSVTLVKHGFQLMRSILTWLPKRLLGNQPGTRITQAAITITAKDTRSLEAGHRPSTAIINFYLSYLHQACATAVMAIHTITQPDKHLHYITGVIFIYVSM